MATATDKQLTGMAGEFLVVGQLFKRDLQASVTFGNAKAIDVLVYNPRTNRNFAVSVKTLRARNCYQMSTSRVSPTHTFVFVLLNKPEVQERFFIVPGADISANPSGFFGASLNNESRPTVNFGPLKPYESNWQLFEQPDSAV